MFVATTIEGTLEERFSRHIADLRERGLSPTNTDELRKAIETYLNKVDADRVRDSDVKNQ